MMSQLTSLVELVFCYSQLALLNFFLSLGTKTKDMVTKPQMFAAKMFLLPFFVELVVWREMMRSLANHG